MKRIISVLISGLLILSTVLCLVVTVKSALGYDPSVFGMRCFYLVSGSMEPTIPSGAAVIVRKDQEGIYEVGDVITFKSTEAAIYGLPNTHRVVDVIEADGAYAYITRGDANPVVDTEPVPSDQVYGEVIWSSGSVKWIGTLFGLLMTPMGFMTVIMLPIMVIIMILLRAFTKEYKKALEAEAGNTDMNTDGSDRSE